MIKTRYRIDGAGSRWVTLVTGIANDLTMWDAQVLVLERGLRILRYDLRGHGGSEATPGPYSMKLLVEDLKALLDSLSVRTTSLVGLGLGGAIAQAFAIEHADGVRKPGPLLLPRPHGYGLRASVAQAARHGTGAGSTIVEPTVQRWFSDEFKAAHGKYWRRYER